MRRPSQLCVFTDELPVEDEEITNSIDEHNVDVAKNRIAAQLYAVLDHYKQEDPVGLPGAHVPDPLDVPDIKKNLGVATLNMFNVKSYGLSKFRIVSVKADLNAMTVRIYKPLCVCVNMYEYIQILYKMLYFIFNSVIIEKICKSKAIANY